MPTPWEQEPRGIRLVDTCSMAGIPRDLMVRIQGASLGTFPAEPECKLILTLADSRIWSEEIKLAQRAADVSLGRC
jgi:hypothetical protein